MGTKINPGDKVKDKITGLTGIVTGITAYLNGCRRVHIQPEKLKDDGSLHDIFSFDEPQVELIQAQVIPWAELKTKSENKKSLTGGPSYLNPAKPKY